MIYKAAFVLPISSDPIENGEVLVRDGVIRAVGTDISASYPEEKTVDFGRAALLPGFVNAHSHLDYTFSPNKSDAANLWDWIDSVGYRRGREPTYQRSLASGVLGAVQMARSGVTCVGDCTFTGAAAEAISCVGLRGIAYLEIFGQSMGPDCDLKFQEKMEHLAHLRANSSDSVKVGLSPHSVYTTNSEVLELCAEACERHNVPISIHLAETAAEADYTMRGIGPLADWRRALGYQPLVSGLRPTQVLHHAGLLRRGVTLAHCIHLDKSEIELLSSNRPGIAHCARSNAYLGCGVAPVPDFLEAGLCVGIGTDSAASCLVMDFFEEMRFALGSHRARAEDAQVLAAKDVLRMATWGGASALALQDQVGTIEPGKRADITVVSLRHAIPDTEVHVSVISRSPSDVIAVLVDGEPVVNNGAAAKVDETEWLERLRRSEELGDGD